MVNIGQRIKDELQRQERTVSWLARKLNCTRASVYRIFEKNSIDTALLANISQVLHHNFFEELSDEVHSSMDE
jgi:DNA invertase Pin-like site-specific DNA recombinase